MLSLHIIYSKLTNEKKRVSFFIKAVLSLITKTEALYFLLIEVEPK